MQMCLNIGQNWLNYFVPLPVTEVTEVTEVMPHWKELIDYTSGGLGSTIIGHR